MKNKSIWMVASVVLTIALSFHFYKKSAGRRGTVYQGEAKYKSDDLDRLEKASTSTAAAENPDVVEALIRLSQKKTPEALQFVLSHSHDSFASIRKSCAQSIGYFDGKEAWGVISELAQDPDPSVRLTIFQSLGNLKSEGRMNLLRTLLYVRPEPSEERLELLISLYRIVPDETSHEAILKQLIQLVRGAKGALMVSALERVLALNSKSEQINKLLQAAVEKSKSPQVVAMGLRKLGAQKDKWVFGRLERMSKNESPIVKQAVVEAITLGCPVNRWDILNNLADHERSPDVLMAIARAGGQLSGDKGELLIGKVESSGRVKDPVHLKAIKDFKDSVKSNTQSGACI